MKNTNTISNTTITSVFNFSFSTKCFILFGLVFVLYANTLSNQYALDDSIVIIQNDYVHQGVSGIKKILSSDAFASYNHKMNSDETALSGGRYRPFSIVIFAIEQQLFGDSPFIRHLVNILCYTLCVITAFYFLNNYLFKKISGGSDYAFLASILFAIHPIHTEVVANIKSLDEILSLLFILGTFIFSINYINTHKIKHLLLGLLSCFLALLSKEYAIMLIFLLPLLFYLIAGEDKKKILLYSLPYYGVAVLYILARVSAVGIPHSVVSNDILSNPYLFASPMQKIATELFVLGKYFIMLIFPYPLSADYSYSQIPYYNFLSIKVLASILFYIGVIAWGVRLVVRHNILAFPVFFYLLNLVLVSNFILDIGATMGERLVFHSSFGFVICIAYGFILIIQKWQLQSNQKLIWGLLSVVVLFSGIEVMGRNKEWKNDDILFAADIKSAPNSFFVNYHVAGTYIRLTQLSENAGQTKYVDSAMKYTRRSMVLHKAPYMNAYVYMGICYYILGELDSEKYYYDTANKIFPNYPPLKDLYPYLIKQYLAKGFELSQKGKTEEGINEIKKALTEDTTYEETWYNLGGAYFVLKRWDSARYAWSKALQLNPNDSNAIRGLLALPVNN